MQLPRRTPPVDWATLPPDPREGEDWFQELPEHLKQEIRDERLAEAHRNQELARVPRTELGDEVRVGAAMFLVLDLCFGGFEFPRLLLAALVGGLVGLAWNRTNAGQLLYPIIAMPAFVLHVVLFAAGGRGSSIALIVGPFLVGCLAAYRGFRKGLIPYEG